MLCPSSTNIGSGKKCIWELSIPGKKDINGSLRQNDKGLIMTRRSSACALSASDVRTKIDATTATKGRPSQQHKLDIYDSSAEEWAKNFRSGLTLLRANVLTLCLRVGIPAKDLWPPEALLLNMDALRRHALERVKNDGIMEERVDIDAFTAPSKCVITEGDDECVAAEISSITPSTDRTNTFDETDKFGAASASSIDPIQQQLAYRYRSHRLNKLLADLSARLNDRTSETADDDIEFIQHSNELQGHQCAPIAREEQDCDWDLVEAD